jgi:uncharacterized protein
MEKWLQITSKGVLLRLQIQPQAKKSEVVGPHGDRLKLKIAAPPVDGKANEALMKFLKSVLKTTVDGLELVRGETSKSKDVLCRKLSMEQIAERINVFENGKPESRKNRKINPKGL